MTVTELYDRIDYWKSELIESGFPISNKIKEIKIGWSKDAAGQCIWKYVCGIKIFILNISKYTLEYKDNKDIDNVIVHELIHTIDGCFNHGREWKSWANKVNYKYGLHVTQYVPERLYVTKNETKEKYGIKCDKCNKIIARYKIMTTPYKSVCKGEHRFWCKKCGSFHLSPVRI